MAASSISSDHTVQNTPISEEKAIGHSKEVFVSEDGKGSSSTFVEEQAVNEIFDSGTNPERKTPFKSERLSHVASPGLDEFKSRAIAAKEKPLPSQKYTVIHRLEPGGKECNYASAKKVRRF